MDVARLNCSMQYKRDIFFCHSSADDSPPYLCPLEVSGTLLIGDFNGDSRDDVLCVSSGNIEFQLAGRISPSSPSPFGSTTV